MMSTGNEPHDRNVVGATGRVRPNWRVGMEATGSPVLDYALDDVLARLRSRLAEAADKDCLDGFLDGFFSCERGSPRLNQRYVRGMDDGWSTRVEGIRL